MIVVLEKETQLDRKRLKFKWFLKAESDCKLAETSPTVENRLREKLLSIVLEDVIDPAPITVFFHEPFYFGSNGIRQVFICAEVFEQKFPRPFR